MLFFTFHDVAYFEVIISEDGIKNRSFGYVESPEGDLHDSFLDALDDNFDEIKKAIEFYEIDGVD